MTRWPKRQAEFAVCINNDGYHASLELQRTYRVLPDDGTARYGDLRIVDESGEDYLYPAACFQLIGNSGEEASNIDAITDIEYVGENETRVGIEPESRDASTSGTTA